MKHVTEFWNLNEGKYTITNLSVQDKWVSMPSACFEAGNIYYLWEESNDIDLTQKEIKFIKNNYPQVIWPMESNGQSIQLFMGPFEFTEEELEELSSEDKDIVNNILEKIENSTMCDDSFAIHKLEELAELTQDGNTINVEVIDIDCKHNMLCYNGYFIFTTQIEFDIIKELPNKESIIEDFIYKIDESDKFYIETEYDGLLDYFNAPFENDYKKDTVTIKTRKEKMPLIKFSRTENNEIIFLVDITTKDNREFRTKVHIKTKEELNQLLQETVDMLNSSTEFSKYAGDIEDYIS